VRILGVDYGGKRIGTALSDESCVIATPLEVLDGKQSLRPQFRRLKEEHDIEKIVIGLPLSMDGSEGPMAEKVKTFAKRIEAWLGIVCVLWDERLTSAQAGTVARKSGNAANKGKNNLVAATIILQSYLDSLAHSRD